MDGDKSGELWQETDNVLEWSKWTNVNQVIAYKGVGKFWKLTRAGESPHVSNSWELLPA